MSQDMHQYKSEHQELSILTEKQHTKIHHLEKKLQQFQDNKAAEFEMISSQLQQALQTELLTLRGKFEIMPPAATSKRKFDVYQSYSSAYG
jgi:arginine deiminase